MKIAIDFDGVLNDTNNVPKGKRMGQPMPGAKEAIAQLAQHQLYCFTVRAANPAGVKSVKDWLEYFGFPDMPVTNEKLNFDLMIDDRAIRFLNWEQVMGEIGA